MKIAVPTNGTQIFAHFGKCEQFTLFTVEDGKIAGAHILDTSAHGHHLMAGFLKENGADVVICGGIGQGAKDTLDAQGIAFARVRAATPNRLCRIIWTGAWFTTQT